MAFYSIKKYPSSSMHWPNSMCINSGRPSSGVPQFGSYLTCHPTSLIQGYSSGGFSVHLVCTLESIQFSRTTLLRSQFHLTVQQPQASFSSWKNGLATKLQSLFYGRLKRGISTSVLRPNFSFILPTYWDSVLLFLEGSRSQVQLPLPSTDELNSLTAQLVIVVLTYSRHLSSVKYLNLKSAKLQSPAETTTV